MNFQSLKTMIDSLIQTYTCPECSAHASSDSVDVIWAAWSTINIDIECPNCGKHSMVKSEVLTLDLAKQGISPENLQQLKEWILVWKMKQNQNKIKDEQIVSLNKNLKKEDFNVSDLLGEQE